MAGANRERRRNDSLIEFSVNLPLQALYGRGRAARKRGFAGGTPALPDSPNLPLQALYGKGRGAARPRPRPPSYARDSARSFSSLVIRTTRSTRWLGTSSKWSKSIVNTPCPCVWLRSSVA